MKMRDIFSTSKELFDSKEPPPTSITWIFAEIGLSTTKKSISISDTVLSQLKT